MQRTRNLRKGVTLLIGTLATALATISPRAQTLPATPPTALTGQTAPTPGAPATATPAPNPPQHAEVFYANGQLQVRADNSSLNQILRSISHKTGLKITGGVQEQRVFGNYGPAPMATVLATLLDGTGTNILLLGGDASTPPELILTTRNGAPEPPGPNSATYAMYDDSSDHSAPVPPPAPHNSTSPAQPQTHVIVGPPNVSQPLNSPSHPTLPAANLTVTRPSSSPMPATTPAASGLVQAPNAAVNSTPTPAPKPSTTSSPAAGFASKPLTPQMVEQELLQMQAQQKLREQQLDEKIRQEQLDQKKSQQHKEQKKQPSPPPASSTPQN